VLYTRDVSEQIIWLTYIEATNSFAIVALGTHIEINDVVDVTCNNNIYNISGG
jgi:hypothetical protein